MISATFRHFVKLIRSGLLCRKFGLPSSRNRMFVWKTKQYIISKFYPSFILIYQLFLKHFSQGLNRLCFVMLSHREFWCTGSPQYPSKLDPVDIEHASRITHIITYTSIQVKNVEIWIIIEGWHMKLISKCNVYKGLFVSPHATK